MEKLILSGKFRSEHICPSIMSCAYDVIALATSLDIDPLSGIPLEISGQDARFSFLDTRKPVVP
jgi:hypothetical protein